MSVQGFTRLTLATAALAFLVTTFGAYVRLSHAGLACPDWPGCYGQLLVPQGELAAAEAARAYPQRPLDAARAWKEMLHRYLAAVLGVLIVLLAMLAWCRRNRPGQQVALPMGLVVLVTLQALLGMWTVTLLLKPLIVTAHLLGGLTTLALLWWLALRHGALFTGYGRARAEPPSTTLGPWVLGGLVVLYAQLFLGGWTSSNYAALACPDFPLCRGQIVPELDFATALVPWHGLGIDYEGGILGADARVTIHFLHRVGAGVVLLYLGALALRILVGRHERPLKHAGFALGLALLAQLALGIGNVVLGLPLAVAVAHNAMAAVLLLALLTVYHVVRPPGIVA